MRILISSQYYHPAYAFGGTVTNAVAIAEGLARLGHEVSVVTTTVVDPEHAPARRSRVENVNGVTVYYLGTLLTFHKSHVNPGVLWFACTQMRNFDALHIIGLYDSLGPILAAFARRLGIPYSVEPSGMLNPDAGRFRLKKAFFRLVGELLLGGAQAIVVTSNKEWSEVVQYEQSCEQLVLRRNGVDLAEYRQLPDRGSFRRKLGILPEESLILWLGRIEPIKNLEQLIAALAALRQHPWQLVIAGPSESKEYVSHLRSLVRHSEIATRTHFLPAMYGDQKMSAFADADLVVLVSKSENWGNTIQEAIAAGVPVLVTDTCGVAEVVEGKGGLVVKKEVMAIREGIRRLLTDRDLYQHFRSRLPALADSLSWDEPVRQMEAMFQSWQSSKTEMET